MQKQFDTVFKDLLIEAGFLPEVAGPKGPEPGLKLLVGVSGGVDSLCLAHLLLHSSVSARIVVAHCNFHLRGAESDGDEAFVSAWCAANGVEFCKTDFDTSDHARKNGLSVEIAAREQRYEWFETLCKERGLGAVVVAHNANDNAETLFLNLLRGTGLRGICGMRPLGVVPVGGKTPLLRPLLGFSREQIETYARANNIHWREDRTNKDSDRPRNILRNEVFPILAEINPSFIRTLNREMQYFNDADDLVESIVPDLLRNGKIDIEELLGYTNWRLFLFYLLRQFNFNSTVINDIAEHLVYDLDNHFFHSPTHRLQITSRNLLIHELTEIETLYSYIYNIGIYRSAGGNLKEVTGGAEGVQGGGKTITVEIIPRDTITDLKAPHGTTYLNADKVRFPFIIRGWRHGDWFRPLGMGGATKKVSDLFVDLKYSVHDKENALFLTLPYDAKSHICALLGERIDDNVKVTPSTKNVLRIRLSD